MRLGKRERERERERERDAACPSSAGACRRCVPPFSCFNVREKEKTPTHDGLA